MLDLFYLWRCFKDYWMSLTYQVDAEAGSVEPLFAVIATDHVQGLGLSAEAEELVGVDDRLQRAIVGNRDTRCNQLTFNCVC